LKNATFNDANPDAAADESLQRTNEHSSR